MGNMDTPETPSAILKACRTGAGLTQSALSARAGLHPNAVAGYESGGRHLSRFACHKLAVCLAAAGCPSDDVAYLVDAAKAADADLRWHNAGRERVAVVGVFTCCHPHAGPNDSLCIYERDGQAVVLDCGHTDVWLDAERARKVGELLIAWATKAEAAP